MNAPLPRVRRVAWGDAAMVREVRLQALAEAPDAFGSTLERERARTPADWRAWIGRGATFVLEDAAGAGGIAAGVPDSDDPTVVFLMSVWVHPRLRGSGAANRLVESVLAFAAEAGAAEVRLHVTEVNHRARRFYERMGFRPTGGGLVRERDGCFEVEMSRPPAGGRSAGGPDSGDR